jgi:serine/threonine-protein kinase
MAEYLIAADAGRRPEADAFLARYPELRADLAGLLAHLSALAGLVEPLLPAGAAPSVSEAAPGPEPGATSPPIDVKGAPAEPTLDPGATVKTHEWAGGAGAIAEIGPAGGAGTTTDPAETAMLGGSDETDFAITLPGGTRVRYFGDYELIRELGRGGMGIVYQARQLSLNRPVALKMIRSAELASEDELWRFQNEAEAVATLDHPHIVPVYEVGELDGQRYFSMKLVGGSSLDQKLSDYTTDPRSAARLLEQAAEAVHHAHQRGILHRDLKPANILIDEHGAPFVTDFGLAKRVADGSDLTVSGAILGTPSYMAPEQTLGRRGAVTMASDTYGLGAVLYALLTGRAPFRGGSVAETLEQVRESSPTPPSKMNPRTPRDLEVICLKCLEKEPGKRYVTAGELADDLRRFEAGEAIRARPVGAHERLWRWCRRKPAVASMALALLAALLAGLVGVATQWRRAESNLREARQQKGRAEENERKQVEANHALRLANDRERITNRRTKERFVAAMSALKKFQDVAKNEALLREPQLEGLRAELLQTALDFYSKFQASLEEDGSPEARSDLAEAYARAAELTLQLGRQDEALAAYRRALAMVERMAAATPDDPARRIALARCHSQIGYTLRMMGRAAEALQSYGQGRAIQESLARDHPGVARYREHLSWTLSQLGVTEQDLGHAAEAIDLHRQALEIHEGLVRHQPGYAPYRNDLGWCWRYLSRSEAAAGDLGAALRSAKRAMDLFEELVRDGRRDVEIRWRLARSLDEIGRIGSLSGRAADAAAALERAAEIHEALARDDPGYYGVDLVRNRLYAAGQRLAAGRPEEARACLRRAENELERSHRGRADLLLHDLSCSHILWSAAGREGAIEPDQREARTRRAITALRRAVLAGHADLMQVRRDPVLDPLRRRRDFEEIIMDLSFPAEPLAR